jgi:YidC/Oxa1 family membrane protein insertase
MILAFQLSDIVTVPFGWLLGFLYELLNNYGLAMIVFAVLVQLILLPITMKSKKSMMKMSRLQPQIQRIKEKYANDQQKQNEAIQQLQKEEGATMGCGGCLWSLVPMLILLPLFGVIRQPIVYILGETVEHAEQIVAVIKELEPTLFSTNNYYDQVAAAQAIAKYSSEISAAIPGISPETLAGINFDFLGINLGTIPQWKFWTWEVWNWASIGAFLIPLLSAGQQMLSMHISQKTNNSVITDEKGLQDKETAENSQTAQQSKMMMYMMPVMSLWIGFTVPSALSLYWFVGGVVRTIEDTILTKHYRKIYDAEDAVRLQKYMEQEAIEAEKERIRAEKRAANPDGITQNTSKKKLQQKQKEEQDAAKAAAAKEYAARKGIAEEEEVEEKQTLSGIADRPYCKGRAYDPNRYHSTEE